MVKVFMASALVLSLVGLSGCSKDLTASSAVRMVQKCLDERSTTEPLLIERRKMGHVVIDSCDHLLLEGETFATANCKLHVELTDAGKAALGDAGKAALGGRPPEGTVSASFGKQPDGTWIITRVD